MARDPRHGSGRQHGGMTESEAPRARRRTASTPFGAGAVTAEIAIPAESRPGDELVAQRIETGAGPLLRVAYRRADRMLRGPVSATPADAAALRRALVGAAEFADVLP
jgi:hypothetical protein